MADAGKLGTGYRQPKMEWMKQGKKCFDSNIKKKKRKEEKIHFFVHYFFFFSFPLQNALHPLFPIPMLACLPAVSRQLRYARYISELIMESCIRHQVISVAWIPFRLFVFFFFSARYLISPSIHHQTTQLQSKCITRNVSAPSTSNISPAIEKKRDLSE